MNEGERAAAACYLALQRTLRNNPRASTFTFQNKQLVIVHHREIRVYIDHIECSENTKISKLAINTVKKAGSGTDNVILFKDSKLHTFPVVYHY
jgi:hypothetical protein